MAGGSGSRSDCAPDWACEVRSPSSARNDLVDKLEILQLTGVPHYWIVEPRERKLTVHRWSPKGYQLVLTAAAGTAVRAEPFETVELRVSTLLGLEDDDLTR